MKILLVSALLNLFALNTFAQISEFSPLISATFNPGLGNGKIYSAEMEHLHGIYNGGNLLINYHIGEHLSISAGIGILTFNANPIVDGQQAVTELDFFQLPVKVNYIGGANAIKFQVGVVGFYNAHLTSVTVMGNNQTSEQTNLGGNYGFAGELGPVFEISSKLAVSVSLEHQFTISKVTGTQIDIENYLVKFGIQYAIKNRN